MRAEPAPVRRARAGHRGHGGRRAQRAPRRPRRGERPGPGLQPHAAELPARPAAASRTRSGASRTSTTGCRACSRARDTRRRSTRTSCPSRRTTPCAAISPSRRRCRPAASADSTETAGGTMKTLVRGITAAALGLPLALLGATAPGSASPAASAGTASATTRGGNGDCRQWMALTFDDGPSHYRTQTLRTLRRTQVPATFFDVGMRVAANPQFAQFEAREGHLVLNHTWSHPHLPALTPAQVRRQVLRTQRVLRQAGAPMPFKLLRPPFGDVDAAVDAQLTRLGLPPRELGRRGDRLGRRHHERRDPRHDREGVPPGSGHPDARRSHRLGERTRRRGGAAAGHPAGEAARLLLRPAERRRSGRAGEAPRRRGPRSPRSSIPSPICPCSRTAGASSPRSRTSSSTRPRSCERTCHELLASNTSPQHRVGGVRNGRARPGGGGDGAGGDGERRRRWRRRLGRPHGAPLGERLAGQPDGGRDVLARKLSRGHGAEGPDGAQHRLPQRRRPAAPGAGLERLRGAAAAGGRRVGRRPEAGGRDGSGDPAECALLGPHVDPRSRRAGRR